MGQVYEIGLAFELRKFHFRNVAGLPNPLPKREFSHFFNFDLSLSQKGKDFVQKNLYGARSAESLFSDERKIAFMAGELRSGKVSKEKANFLLSLLVESASEGDWNAQFKMRLFKETASAPNFEVVYPGSYKDVLTATLAGPNAYAYHMIDPMLDFENRKGLLAELARHSDMKKARLKEHKEDFSRISLGAEKAAFSIYAKELANGKAPNSMVLEEIGGKISAVVIKKPCGSLLGLLDDQKWLHKAISSIAKGGFLLFSDIEKRFEIIAIRLCESGMRLVCEGKLESTRVFSGGEKEDYPAALFRKL